MHEKRDLRREMRSRRREFVDALPEQVKGLVFSRPPLDVVSLLDDARTIGLYYPNGAEASPLGWARWLFEQGKNVALPRLDTPTGQMTFRLWTDPWSDDGLETGPHGIVQPGPDGPEASPDALVVPLLAFTAAGDRLGQGGGHYDRWFATNKTVPRVGLAWDCQLVETLPLEAHDHGLDAIVTPTRIFWSNE